MLRTDAARPESPVAPRAGGEVSGHDACSRAKAVLWAEFLFLYVGIPLGMAFLLPPNAMWPMMGGALLFALIILHRQPGFRWRERISVPSWRQWGLIAGFGIAVSALCAGLVLALRPEAFLSMPRYRPELWMTIMLLYPVLSALPQEIIWRSLFFERYGRLFPSEPWLLAANGAAFGLAHLFFWNGIAVAMTAVGGALFGWVYLRAGPRRALAVVTLLHALAGMALFTAGLGTFFYHGAAGR